MRGEWGTLSIPIQSVVPELLTVLTELCATSVREDEIEGRLLASSIDALAQFYFMLSRIRTIARVERIVSQDDNAAFSIETCSRYCNDDERLGHYDFDVPLELSRFAFLRKCHLGMTLESPLAHLLIKLHESQLFGIPCLFSRPSTLRTILGTVDRTQRCIVDILLRHLCKMEILISPQAEDRVACLELSRLTISFAIKNW